VEATTWQAFPAMLLLERSNFGLNELLDEAATRQNAHIVTSSTMLNVLPRWMHIPEHEKPPFRHMGSQHSGSWEASFLNADSGTWEAS